MKKQALKSYAVFILLSEAVGALAGWLTREGTAFFQSSVARPPLTPPGAAFPIVWGVLFLLMGIGAARVYQARASEARTRGLRLFFLQLAVNFLWSLIFFNLRLYGLAFFWLIALLILILLMTIAFRKADRAAAYLQIPYLLWVAFAGYLTLGVWMLN